MTIVYTSDSEDGPATFCLSCEERLVPDIGCPNTNYQFDNALWIGFHGGYSMFVDNMVGWEPEAEGKVIKGSDYEAVICHECAHQLCNAIPWINKLLDPLSSHSHTTSYIESHPYHTGWDYNRRKAKSSE